MESTGHVFYLWKLDKGETGQMQNPAEMLVLTAKVTGSGILKALQLLKYWLLKDAGPHRHLHQYCHVTLLKFSDF